MDSNELRELLILLEPTSITNETLGELVRALLVKTTDVIPDTGCPRCDNDDYRY